MMWLLKLINSAKIVHQNYVGIDSEKNPYFLSIVSHESGNKSTPLYRAMLFRKQVCTLSTNVYQFIEIANWAKADKTASIQGRT